MKKLKEKTSEYFSHDYYARNELQQVLMELGHEGKSVYWDLVEMLYENGCFLKLADIKTYAFALHTTPEVIEKLISEDFGLFKKDDTVFWSESAIKRLEKRLQLKEIRSESGKRGATKRWYGREEIKNIEKKPSKPSNKTNNSKTKKIEYKKIPDIEFTNLTEIEYQKLYEKHKERFLKALTIFDTWLSKKTKTAKEYIGKPHYAHFRADAWVWERADEAMRKDKANNANAISSQYGHY